MIFGKNFKLLLLALLLALPTLAADPLAPTLEEILNPNNQPLEMRYREEKTLHILDQTLTSSGRLRFIPPDTLVREVDGWRGMVYRIEGNQINISEGDRVLRQLDLGSSPELAGFATTLRALLAADIETLTNHYDLTLTGSTADWSLQLIPRNEPLSRLVERISIEGGDGQIRLIDTFEWGGNHSRMALLPDE